MSTSTVTSPTVTADRLARALLGDGAARDRVDHDRAESLAALLETGQLRAALADTAAAVAAAYTTRESLQQAPRVPADVLDRLVGDGSAHRRSVAAGARALRAAQARTLAGDADPDVRTVLAGNAAALPGVLAALAADARKEVRQAAATNPATPAGAVAGCLDDRAGAVVVAARSGLLHRAAGGQVDAATALTGQAVRDLLSCHDGHPYRSRSVPHLLQVLQAAVTLGGDPDVVAAALFDGVGRRGTLDELVG